MRIKKTTKNQFKVNKMDDFYRLCGAPIKNFRFFFMSIAKIPPEDRPPASAAKTAALGRKNFRENSKGPKIPKHNNLKASDKPPLDLKIYSKNLSGPVTVRPCIEESVL